MNILFKTLGSYIVFFCVACMHSFMITYYMPGPVLSTEITKTYIADFFTQGA